MSKKSVIIYEDWAFTLKELPDDQAIKVMKAMLGYAFYGESLDNVDQIAKAIVTPWCKEIDKNMASYKAKVENMNANRKKSQEKKDAEIKEKSVRDQAEIISKDKDVDDDKDKDIDVVKKEVKKKEKPKPKTESIEELLANSTLDPFLKEKVKLWINYKREQFRFSYKPIGFKAFLTEISDRVDEFGVEIVSKVFDKSMSLGYKGVIWDFATTMAKSKNRVAQQLDDSYKMISSWGNGGDDVVGSW